MMLRKISFVFFISLLVSHVYSQKYHFIENNGKNGLKIESSKSDVIDCSFAIESFQLTDVEVEKTHMNNIIWGSSFLPGKEGEPQLPSITKNFIIPHGSEIEIKIGQSSETIYKEILIAPAAKTPINSKNEFFPVKRGPVYSQNSFYPSEPLSYHITEIRGMQILVLSVIPFQYNPITKELLVNTQLEIDIHINSSSTEYIEERFRSPFWDQILADIIYNKDDIPEINYNTKKVNVKNEGCELLILAPNRSDFLQWADTIRRFRNEQGVYTKIVTTEEIGGNQADTIKSFFEEIYHSWDPVPSAVLLLGDWGGENDGVLSKVLTDHPEDVGYISDSYFSDVTNNELPDFVIARISANDSIELESIITKYIAYEKKPPLAEHFYKEPLVLSAFQNELWFQICSESINGFMKNSLGKSPKRINEFHNNTSLTDNWSTAPNSAMPINYFGINGLKYIPETPTEAGHWGDGDSQDIITAINKGASLTFFRDHGGDDLLWIPNFEISHIPLLQNKRHPTFLFAFGCYGGAFNYENDCIIEAMHKYNDGGINGGIAATTLSYSFYNDVILWGITDHLWPDFLPDYGSNSSSTRDFRPAFGLAASKYYMMNSNWIPEDFKRILTSRIWTHFGDPFGIVYTSQPSINPVEHTYSISNSTQSIQVKAEPFSVIGLSNEGELLNTQITDENGNAVLNFQAQEEMTKLKLVVSKQDFLRYEKNIYVVQDTGSFAKFSSYKMYDANNNTVLENLENAKMDISIINYGNDVLYDVELKLSINDPFIKMLNDSIIIIDSIIANSEITLQKILDFNTKSKIPDQHEVVINIEITSNGIKKLAHIKEIIDAPIIEFSPLVYNEIVWNNYPNQRPDPGEILEVSFRIKNIGHIDIMDNELIITSSHPDIHNTINSFSFNKLSVGDDVEISFQMEVSSSAQIANTYAIICKLNTSKGRYNKYYYFNGGQVIENWETADFNKFEWYFTGDKDWEIDDFAYQSNHSAIAQGLNDNEEAALLLDYHVWMDDYIEFKVYTFTEPGKDTLSFYIDSTLMDSWSGLKTWRREVYNVAKGDHTFKWVYKKDSVNSLGDDIAHIDNIILPVGQKITSLENQKQKLTNTINVFPNPANDNIRISNNSNQTITQIVFLDILGNAIRKNSVSIQEKEYISMNISSFPKGIYLLTFVLDNEKNQTQKLIIN